jgi:hypothetical protein
MRTRPRIGKGPWWACQRRAHLFSSATAEDWGVVGRLGLGLVGRHRLATGGTVITCAYPLNVLKDTYSHRCY